MANEQHIEWLCEGVDAWNARRRTHDFTPDFSNAADLADRLVQAGWRTKNAHADLRGADLRRADFSGAKLRGADLRGADLRGAILKGTDLLEADLSGADVREADFHGAILVNAGLIEADLRGATNLRAAILKGTVLRGANLLGADLRGAANLQALILMRANLSSADLREADLSSTDLREAILVGADLTGARLSRAELGRANVRSVQSELRGNDVGAPEPTDLSKTNGITQRQLDQMIGDRWTLIPDDLTRPAHWMESEAPALETAPSLPSKPAHQRVELNSDEKLAVESTHSAPNRSDLETLYDDLRHSIEDLQQSGGLGNLSPLLSKGCDRFFKSLPESFTDLDDVRFAVGAETLRLRVEAERGMLAREAPEKIGHLDAVLYTADLIKARLPGWIAFLQEEAEVKPIFEARTEEAVSILEDAAEGLSHDPERFDTSLFDRIREYLDSKTMEGYLAAKDLLVAIAYRTFSLVLSLSKDVLSEQRTLAIQGIAAALNVQLGATLFKLAGMLPKELDWIVRWQEYLPKVI